MLKNIKKPKEIKQELDKYIIGQHDAKKKLSVAAYNHLKRSIGHKNRKNNLLFIGPTGCGKTYMVSTLSSIINVPFLTVDATSFTSAGYQGRSVEEIVIDLISMCNDNEMQAENSIVYIDEIDKIRRSENSDSEVNNIGVQQSLLKLIEGSEVSYVSKKSINGESDKKFNTKNVLFICSGAFQGLEDVRTENLIDFGMMPEFLGRFSSVSKLDKLNKEDYKNILKNSKDSILVEFKRWFLSEGCSLVVKEDAIDFIAKEAEKKDLGARGLHGILDDIFLDIQYELPSMTLKPSFFILDKEAIEKNKLKRGYKKHGQL
jgi:ATP-dependent Clp protease ATP-binding subunit ClpX